MKIVFVGDGHFKGSGDPNQAAFVTFLDSLKADTLVITGDLFDFWAGSNSVARRHYKPVLDSLLRLKDRGTQIIYCEGNHDFSMGPFFENDLKAAILESPAEIEIKGRRFFLGHGDTIEMTAGYRLWRGYLRSPVYTVMASIATGPVVWAIANSLSKKSRKRSYPASSHNATEERLRKFARQKIGEGAEMVVLGHSHAPGVHQEKAGKRKGVYANPGSWAKDRTYLVYDGKAFKMNKAAE